MKHTVPILSLLLIILLIAGCNSKNNDNRQSEDRTAKELLWGKWVKSDDGSEAFTAKGDTIYFPDPLVLPVAYYIKGDSLILESTSRMSYKIIKQSEHIFRILNQNNEEIGYVKADAEGDEEQQSDDLIEENADGDPTVADMQDSKTSDDFDIDEADEQQIEADDAENIEEVVETKNKLTVDTVIDNNSIRYRCTIVPRNSYEKVVHTSFNEDGIGVDKVYYDNIIEVKVYNGSTLLLKKNFRKNDFAKFVAASELKQCILSDIEYVSVSDKGVVCQALVSPPDSPASYAINITVSPKGGYKLSKAE